MLQPSRKVRAESSVESLFLLFPVRISNPLSGKVQSKSYLQELRSLLLQLFAGLSKELRGEHEAAASESEVLRDVCGVEVLRRHLRRIRSGEMRRRTTICIPWRDGAISAIQRTAKSVST